MSVFEITKAAVFDAAHHFPSEPEGSPYRRIHGHSFQVEATVRGETLDAAHGWVADLGALDRALKAAAPVVQTSGQELKLVYPQPAAMPDRFEHLAFERFWLQPMDGPDQAANTAAAIDYCLTHPKWRLSVQTHKYIGVR